LLDNEELTEWKEEKEELYAEFIDDIEKGRDFPLTERLT
jgi:hypothetical protein